MSTKVMVCRCEDVTLADIEHTLSLGYASVEEVKRYTGLGTGPCQGKECMALVAHLCARAGGQAAAPSIGQAAGPFTSRPPIEPVELGLLARGDEDPAGERRS